MTDPAKIEQLGDVESRLLRFTEILSRAMATASLDQASHLSGALQRVSHAVNSVKQARYSTSDKVSTDQLRQALENLQLALDVLQKIGRTDIPLGDLRSMTEEIKTLAA